MGFYLIYFYKYSFGIKISKRAIRQWETWLSCAIQSPGELVLDDIMSRDTSNEEEREKEKLNSIKGVISQYIVRNSLDYRFLLHP